MKKLIALLVFCCTFHSLVFAQTDGKPNPPVKNIFSGYLQNQFQITQGKGVSSWAGGDFDNQSDNRFMIRRGRLRFQHQQGIAQATVQLDATPDAVRFIEAFIQVKRQQDDALSLTAGLFDRPFGYAIAYSSAKRDFPERPMVFQNLFPKEKDLGAMLSWRPSKDLSFLSFDIAAINGSGITAKDYDGKKDIVGNLHVDIKKIAANVKLGFGASFYKGFVKSGTVTYFSPQVNGFQKITDPAVADRYFERNYLGANLQVELASSWGASSFKTEYIQGKQPGVAQSASTTLTAATRSFSSLPKTDIYQRNFKAYYLWFTQQLGNSKLHALLSYDYYDPNTDAEGSALGLPNSNTTAADLKFTTWGYGLAFHANEQVKFTAFYDRVINEKSALAGFTQDKKDDVFTLRLQYKW